VRAGYESAFEEIVRRYRRPLDRFAASIVGGRSEDVTQDSFRKALEALRGGDAEVELRPWLYRIVRNTALNDLRDRPPAAAELAEELIGGGRSAAAEAEERAEVTALTARLRALPEKQRAALVMRELEGMSHEEIAAALGISGGAARQAIARGRAALRSGLGVLVPLPLLRAFASGGDGAGEAAAGAAASGGVAAGGAVLGGAAGGASASALGGGIALKVGLATVVVAGSIGAGVAIDHGGAGHRQAQPPRAPRATASAPGGPSADGVGSPPSPVLADVGDKHRPPAGDDHAHRGRGGGVDDDRGRGHRGPDDRRARGGRADDGKRGDRDDDVGVTPRGSSGATRLETDEERSSGGGSGPGPSGSSGNDQPGGSDSRGGHGGADSGSTDPHSGSDGHGGSGGTGSGSRGGSDSGSSTSSHGGGGSEDATEPVIATETASPSIADTSGSSSSDTSGSSSSDTSGSSGSSGGSGSTSTEDR
jgi:RNA polymerase sigma factor (sigma-70 family)